MIEMIELDINIDSRINPNDLDLEWREQAHLFSLYAQKQAEAIYTKNRLESRLNNEFRQSWDVNWGKQSEAAIKTKIESRTDFIEAEYQVNVASGYIRAMEHKKQALENLVKLAGMNYFATPREPKNLNRQFSEKADREEVKERINKSLNKSRKSNPS